MNYYKGLIGAVFLLLGAAHPLAAQTMGTIQGTVTDSKTGDPLPGVQVTVEGTLRRTVTNGSGQYNFSIEPGTYTLMAVTLGFNKSLHKVSASANGTTITNFALTGVGTADQLASLMNELKEQRRLIDELLRRVALLEQKK
jgi:protocatechuate 3,4-dioxygenase beta subunit